VTVEDRLRATTEAVAAATRPLRPLDLRPDAAGRQAPARRRPARPARSWRGWLIPLAAAMTVIAVAAALTVVRGLSTGAGAPYPPASPSDLKTGAAALPSGFPRYYATGVLGGPNSPGAVIVGDALTGKLLATVKPPSGVSFGAIAASADDRTFVVEAIKLPDTRLTAPLLFYVLRLYPGTAQPVRLTRIPVAPIITVGGAGGGALAVSPDGRAFAVTFRDAGQAVPVGPVMLRTYSVATGQPVHTWTAPPSDMDPAAFGRLTWLDDGRTLAFVYPVGGSDPGVRILNTSNPRTSLVGDSRPVGSAPAGQSCHGPLVTADVKSVICGTDAVNNGWCATGRFTLRAYSVATGKLDRVLYRYQGKCGYGISLGLWAKSGTLAIAAIVIGKLSTAGVNGPATVLVGAVTPGKFTVLPVPLTVAPDHAEPGAIGF
jgi:hypothetical protein